MKRILSQISIVVGLLLVMTTSGFAAPLGPTVSTLSAAVAWSTQTTTLSITSTSGMTVSTQPGVTAYVLIDAELMRIISIVSSTSMTVSRRGGSTIATPHASGAYVVYGTVYGTSWDQTATGSPTYGTFLARGVRPEGACTLSSQQYNVVFETVDLAGNPSPYVDSCVGGVWSRGGWPATVAVTALKQCTIPIGGAGTIVADMTAYGTDSTRVAGTIYIGSIDVSKTTVVTTLSSLTGTTAPTTDSQLFAIYDSAPGTTSATVLGSTAIAGAAAATADIMFAQSIALVGGAANTNLILVPGRYFFALQINGTTTSIQMVATADGRNGLVGNSRTGTFGTLAALTVPTTLTASTAPIGCINQ